MTQSIQIDGVLKTANDQLDHSLDRLFDLLRIPSVSTDPAYAEHCQKAAEWLSDMLSGLGFESSVKPTGGQPMVLAHWTPKDVKPGTPRALFYGHYDVQPADPEDLWDRPAFDPALVDGPNGTKRIHGRGACDDKGQLMTFLEACRAWINETGDLPVPVTVLLEGEEETGSPNLEPFLEAHAKDLEADIALVCDTAMWDEKTPAITTMLRGMVASEIVLTGPERDLHSGIYGGAARNPIHVLSRILADLHDADGRIQLPDFYEGVETLPEDQKEQWDALGRTAEDFLSEVGLKDSAGESGLSVLEQTWARPTCDVNGITGGYQGDGTKTIIPSKASAKVSFRLVGRQDPDKILATFHRFVQDRVPADCKVSFIDHGASPALTIDTSNPHLETTKAALLETFENPPALIGCGGSIPIVGSFKERLGIDSLLVGFGLENDQVHSPNEKYELSSYHNGIRSWVRILGGLAA